VSVDILVESQAAKANSGLGLIKVKYSSNIESSVNKKYFVIRSKHNNLFDWKNVLNMLSKMCF
jgi:hypothetical protein